MLTSENGGAGFFVRFDAMERIMFYNRTAHYRCPWCERVVSHSLAPHKRAKMFIPCSCGMNMHLKGIERLVPVSERGKRRAR